MKLSNISDRIWAVLVKRKNSRIIFYLNEINFRTLIPNKWLMFSSSLMMVFNWQQVTHIKRNRRNSKDKNSAYAMISIKFRCNIPILYIRSPEHLCIPFVSCFFLKSFILFPSKINDLKDQSIILDHGGFRWWTTFTRFDCGVCVCVFWWMREYWFSLFCVQRLKAALHAVCGKICEQMQSQSNVSIDKKVVAAIGDLTFQQIGTFCQDLDAFAK